MLIISPHDNGTCSVVLKSGTATSAQKGLLVIDSVNVDFFETLENPAVPFMLVALCEKVFEVGFKEGQKQRVT